MPKQAQIHNQRQARHQAILDLIQGHYIKSQAELQDLLVERGLEVNQGTVSRDLRELGVVKAPDGYELPNPTMPSRAASNASPVESAVRLWLVNRTAVQNQVILKTPPGGAQPLALTLDKGPYPRVIGTIAGDDTILVICKNARDAQTVDAELEAML
ncbi:MAG: ArgR family transcriptional regulator [Planctomycetota bacterium]|nr:ArgR family transcriptional regulator [Planctomycetota bacterium]